MGEDSHCQEGVRASLPPVIDHQTWHPPTQSIRLPFLAALSSLLQTPSTHHRKQSAINEEDDLSVEELKLNPLELVADRLLLLERPRWIASPNWAFASPVLQQKRTARQAAAAFGGQFESVGAGIIAGRSSNHPPVPGSVSSGRDDA